MLADTQFTIRGLTEGEEYEFQVAALNKAGQGSFSTPSQKTICKRPTGKFTLESQYVQNIVSISNSRLAWRTKMFMSFLRGFFFFLFFFFFFFFFTQFA